ncbi:MAG: NUDIX hydrolase [Bdellovibrionales bacterium]
MTKIAKILGLNLRPNPTPLFKETTADITFPDGKVRTWSYVEAPDIAVIVALDPQGNVYLKREWRLAHDQELAELPSGRLNPDESPAVAAARELKEEVGLTPSQVVFLQSVPLWNHGTVKAHIFLALDCTLGDSAPDEGEFIEPVSMPLVDAIAYVEKAGSNAQTLLGLRLAQEYLNRKE